MARLRAAQRKLKSDARPYSENELLDSLTVLLCKNKFLSRDLICASEHTPSSQVYQIRFGNLTNAYRRVGFLSERNANREDLQRLRTTITDEIVKQLTARGCAVGAPRHRGSELCIDGRLNITVVLGRARKSGVSVGHNEWQFGHRSARESHILIVARIESATSSVRDYFVLPFLFLPPGAWVTVSGRNYVRLEPFRMSLLDPFFEACECTPLDQLSS